jgi:alpha-L-rhamnosidase
MDTAPGYREFELQPIPGGTLTYAEAVLESPLGEIRSSWKKNENGFEYCCSIPVGACARLTLPNGEKHRLPSGEYKFVI